MKKGKLKSRIDFKPPGLDAFDGEKLNKYVLDEYGQWAKPDPNFNWKDIIKKAKDKGSPLELKFSKPKQLNNKP